MDAAEFDQFADEYDAQHRSNIAITGEDPSYFAAYKVRLFAKTLRARSITASRIVDFGSGIGNSIPYFHQYLPATELTGADVSQRSLDLSESRFPVGARLLRIEGDRIPTEDDSFDAAFSACVFHHIPHDQHVGWLAELRRVVRAGGMLTIFEHNPMNPLTVRAVNTCPFDENARLIRAGVFAARYRSAGWRDLTIRYHIFFPRALASLRGLEPHMAWIPFGGQYSITAVKRA
jgi:ubiquinone/menaquinone biosynthesis C-methylase UbiE